MKNHPLVGLLAFSILLGGLSAGVGAQRSDEPRPLYIEAYCDHLSYEPGDTVGFHVSASREKYSMEIFRLGAETVKVWSQKNLPGKEYSIPENASSHGCRWPVGTTLNIPEDWASGFYRVRFRVEDRGGKFIHRNLRTAEGTATFILRSATPGQDSGILLQLAVNTYNAYNNWGGSSLYGYHGRNGLQGHRVSFDRPVSGLFDRWELPFIQWAEKAGYRLDYASNMDLELRPELLKKYRLILSVGHDEYWSAPMRDHLEAFIESGGNVAFFSGNSVCWQVRYEAEGRALTCWKQWYNQDPVYPTSDNRLLSTLWSHHRIGRPENTLTGVGFLHGGYHLSHGQFMDGKGSYTVHRPDHWVFEGTSLKRNDEFGGADTIVGYECDGCEIEWKDGLPYPTHKDGTPKGFTILGTCPARWAPGDSFWYDEWPGPDHVGNAVLGIYQRGGTVFTVGSTDWSHGLRGEDPTVIRITENVLDRLSR
jgi:hypothetical protein